MSARVWCFVRGLRRPCFLAGLLIGTVLVAPRWGYAGPGADSARPGATNGADRARAEAERVCKVKSFALNRYVRKLDGQWQGCRYASDGNVYFASSSHAHDHGAALFRYDPRSGKLTMLCEDISRTCGEDPTKTTPQGKIHSDIVESKGKLYFATHLANYWPAAARKYTGSHLVSLDMATGKFRDWGVLKPQFTCYAGLAVDPKGRYAYALLMTWVPEQRRTAGTRIARVELATGKIVDLGAAPAGRGACYYVFVDRRGDCWFTLSGNLYVARAATGKIEVVKGALGALRLPSRGELKAAGSADRWGWGQPAGDGERFFCTMNSRGRAGALLYEFDVRKMPDVKAAFRPLVEIGPTGLGMALTRSRLYYRQRAGRRRRSKGSDHHLMSVSLAPKDFGTITDHGLVLDQAGRRPWRFDAMAADGKGKVFLVGDWYLNKGEKGTYRLSYRWRPGQPFKYDELWRGQFFAVADVSADFKARPP